MIIKINLEKPYDKLEWSFIADTLHEIGLLRAIIGEIMECILSSYFQLIWNGEATDCVQPTRGL